MEFNEEELTEALCQVRKEQASIATKLHTIEAALLRRKEENFIREHGEIHTQLKPCPFCGSRVTIETTGRYSEVKHIDWEGCGCRFAGITKNGTEKNWNKRVGP
jgi:DNA repair exonuclease SbcCD ATPase subunit